jgi:hypothetical protein
VTPKEYKAAVRALPCCACGVIPPDGCDPHHITYVHGIGKKSSDFETIPMCRGCHDDFHVMRGRFRTMPRDRRRVWQRDHVVRTQRALGHCPTAAG